MSKPTWKVYFTLEWDFFFLGESPSVPAAEVSAHSAVGGNEKGEFLGQEREGGEKGKDFPSFRRHRQYLSSPSLLSGFLFWSQVTWDSFLLCAGGCR